MMTYLADQELIKAIKDRNQIGAEALYNQYAAILFKIICCKTGDLLTAESVLEETFLKIWTNINSYQPENGRLLLWMTGIARTLAISSCTSTSVTPMAPELFGNESIAMPLAPNLILGL